MRKHHYTDVSNWSTPYDLNVFDYDWLGGLGAQPEITPATPGTPAEPATTPATITPEVTIYGSCDFTAGKYVEQVQTALIQAGALSAQDALAEKGIFGEATCEAWRAKYGHYPTAADLVQTLGPNVSCASITVPGCAAQAEAASAWTPGKILLYGAGLVGILVVARALGRKKR